MRNFLSVNRNQATILIIIIGGTLLIAGYFFIQVPEKEKELQREQFRWLQRIDQNVQTKIENSEGLLSNKSGKNCKDVKSIITDDNQRQFVIRIGYDSLSHSSCDSLVYSFEDFITPLLINKTIFEQYVIFHNSAVVYEYDKKSPTGLSYKLKDSLLQARNGIFGSAIIDEKVA